MMESFLYTSRLEFSGGSLRTWRCYRLTICYLANISLRCQRRPSEGCSRIMGAFVLLWHQYRGWLFERGNTAEIQLVLRYLRHNNVLLKDTSSQLYYFLGESRLVQSLILVCYSIETCLSMYKSGYNLLAVGNLCLRIINHRTS